MEFMGEHISCFTLVTRIGLLGILIGFGFGVLFNICINKSRPGK